MFCSKATQQSTKITLNVADLDVGICPSGQVMMAVTPIPLKFLRTRIDAEIRRFIVYLRISASIRAD
uniref:Uncharacterized protein n=1 Tax=uncultured bacterium A1Q1_fos_485 TaxID=1256576 RepID=L7W087_9BACT|nr:hypothetical protein [uncultured bacterium A1Q1_fos_485]